MEYCITSVFKRGFATWNIVLPLYSRGFLPHEILYCRCIQESFCHMEYYLAAVFKRVFATKNTVLPLYSRGVLSPEILYYRCIQDDFCHMEYFIAAVMKRVLPLGIFYHRCVSRVCDPFTVLGTNVE